MKIVLTSTNLAKRTAAQETFAKYFSSFSLQCLEVDSGVSKTPTTDQEGITGCLNRIKKARQQIPNADIYIGLEGVISKNKYGAFVYGWCVVETVKPNRQAMAASAKVMLPKYIAKKAKSFKELSLVMKKHYPSKLSQQINKIGTNGIITNKKYTRIKEFEDALDCALCFLNNDKNFRLNL